MSAGFREEIRLSEPDVRAFLTEAAANVIPTPPAVVAGEDSTHRLDITGHFDEKNGTTFGQSNNVSHSASDKSATTYLKCLRVRAFNPANPRITRNVFVLLDDGSCSSFITTEAASSLQLAPLSRSTLELYTAGSQRPSSHSSSVVDFGLVLTNGDTMVVQANSIDTISRPLNYLYDLPTMVGADVVELPVDRQSPDVLLGSDVYNELQICIQQKLAPRLYVGSCLLGKFITGTLQVRLDLPPGHSSTSMTTTTLSSIAPRAEPTTEQVALNQMVEDYFSFESIGIELPEAELTKEDVLESFLKTLHFDDPLHRYVVGLPFRKPMPDLPSNQVYAMGRFRSLLRQLAARPAVLQKFHKNYVDEESQGIIEDVTDFPPDPGKCHYLAHQAVVRDDKDKVRNVHDAAARAKKGVPSLNDCLFPGPLLLNELVGILFRWRLHSLIALCDIKSAFLQVVLRPEDRDYTRFYWVKDPDQPPVPPNLREFRFCRVAFGLTCSPFLLAGVIHFHASVYPSSYVQEILDNLYVDNIMLRAESEEELKEKVDHAIEFFDKAGMPLREFYSNSPSSIAHLPEDAKETKPVQKLLGISWDAADDSIKLVLPKPSSAGSLTKKSLLSSVASCYDPMGLLSPVTIAAKLLLQECWEEKKGWNEYVGDRIARLWAELTKDWTIVVLSIPRLIASRFRTAALHVFSDASMVAAAAAVYLRVVTSTGEVVRQLLFSKTRTRPANKEKALKYTNPKLELIAAVLGVRIAKLVREQLRGYPLDDITHLWCDNSPVLGWLCTPAAQEVFVANRLKELKSTPHLIVRHVPTRQNPADLPSRGITATELGSQHMQFWFNGPDWLSQPEENWPRTPDIPVYRSDDKEPELVDDDDGPDTNTSAIPRGSALHCNLVSTAQKPSELFEIDRFTSFSRLLRVTSYVLRFVQRSREKAARRLPILSHPLNWKSERVSMKELRRAQIVLVRCSQRLYPPRDLDNANLQLHHDCLGLLRSRGQVYKVESRHYAPAPIYLPPEAPLTRLIVMQAHRVLIHAGPGITLMRLRRIFWLPRGRRVVSNVLHHDCEEFKRYHLKPFHWRSPPQLPDFRIETAPPFAATGVDYFGPLTVSLEESRKEKSKKHPVATSKVYGCLFTCLVSRAIHLELAPDLSAEAFLAAFERFTNRRMVPRLILSDNGGNFVSGSKVVKLAYEQLSPDEKWRSLIASEPIRTHAESKGIKWVFVCERAPWRGGAYERMVSLVKHQGEFSGVASSTTSPYIHSSRGSNEW